MWERVLVALDQYESGQVALVFTTQLAEATQSDVRVLHVRPLSKWARVPPLETPTHAADLVDEAVLHLQLASVRADGHTCSVFEDLVALRIVEESLYWMCDAIVLGTRRLRGISRLSSWGTRERVIRLSPLPVIAAPTPLNNGIHEPYFHKSDQLGHTDPGPPRRGDTR